MDKENSQPFLDETTVTKNPFRQFENWYGEAYRLLGEDASAMALVTEMNHQPDARIVYLRGSDKKAMPDGRQGFWFFTNYRSQKAHEIKKNNKACLLFFWARMGRQVRIFGTIEKLPAKESDSYFANRLRESQISAWASPQSQIITNREVLEAWEKEFSKLFEGKKVPRPSHWGGYRFVPSYFEFWYVRESRLHDRVFFRKQKNGKWKIGRIAP